VIVALSSRHRCCCCFYCFGRFVLQSPTIIEIVGASTAGLQVEHSTAMTQLQCKLLKACCKHSDIKQRMQLLPAAAAAMLML
jgi:hypothetical protein